MAVPQASAPASPSGPAPPNGPPMRVARAEIPVPLESPLPDIRVTQAHDLPPSEVPARLASFDERLRKVGAHLEWKGQEAAIRGVPGVGGHVKVTASQVDVLVKFSRLVTMMGLDPKRLERTIRKSLVQALTDPAAE